MKNLVNCQKTWPDPAYKFNILIILNLKFQHFKNNSSLDGLKFQFHTLKKMF